MWKPLFLYYFLLIATMTKTMFANSQQLLFILFFICEVITFHKINIISLFLFILSFIPSRTLWDNQLLDSKLIFIIYISRTRLHRRIIKQNPKLDHTKLYSTRSRYYQKDRTRKTVKIKVWWWYDTGALPQAWQLPRGVPIPDTQFSFGGSDDGVVDDVGLSSIFQGIGSPS